MQENLPGRTASINSGYSTYSGTTHYYDYSTMENTDQPILGQWESAEY